MTQYGQDEILELLWTLREEGKASRAELLRTTAEDRPEALLAYEQRDHIERLRAALREARIEWVGEAG